jgi:hypothetical protein
MDRNGKKPKAAPSDASRNAERSDTKASARDPLGRAGGLQGSGAPGTGNVPGRPAQPGRKGHRG